MTFGTAVGLETQSSERLDAPLGDIGLTSEGELPLTSRLLVVSASDADALKRRIADVLTHVASGGVALSDVAYTLAFGRQVLSHRAAVVLPHGVALPDACKQGAAWTSNGKPGAGRPSTVFMFPGQGSQFLGMGRELYQREDRFRQVVDHCASVLEPKLGLNLTELLFAPLEGTDTSRAEALKQTAIAQPALFVVEYALAEFFQRFGVRPDALIGHSIGEYTAACLAGVFELDAALRLVAERGRLMQSMEPGSMLAVMADLDEVEPLCVDGIDLAAYNAPGVVVVSGPTPAIDAFARAATGRGVETRVLQTSHAFHSAMMDPILEPFIKAVEAAAPSTPRIPIFSTMTGLRLTDDEARSPSYWASQLRNAVRFADAVASVCAEPDRLLLEVGPGIALSSSAAKQRGSVNRPRKLLETLGHPKGAPSAVDAMLRTLGQLWIQGADANWATIFPGDRFTRLPAYPYTRKRHWINAPSSGLTGTAAPLSAVAESAEPEGSPEERVLHALGDLLGARLGVKLNADDLEATYLELGFDSLALSQLAGKLRQDFGVRVSVRRLFEDLNTPAALAAHLVTEGASVSASVRSLPGKTPDPSVAHASRTSSDTLDAILQRLERIEQSLRQAPAESTQRPSATLPSPTPTKDSTPGAPLTASQREIWLAVQLGGEPANLAYNESRAFHFRGPLRETAIHEAVAKLVERHESLRMTFSVDGERCVTHPTMDLALEQTDLRAEESSIIAERVAATMREQVKAPFNLVEGPLLRGHLLRIAEEEAHLVLCAHHVAVDGSSWEVLIRELSELYSALVEGRPSLLPEADQFSLYRESESCHARSDAGRSDEAFWLSHLEGQSEALDLPADTLRPAQRTFSSAREDQRLLPELVEGARATAQQASCTMQTLLLGAFQVLLYRLTRQTDLVVGVPTSGQAAAGMESLVGHCVHVLPLRTNLDPEGGLYAHLRSLHGTMLDGLEHQWCTFTELLPKLKRQRDPSRPALIQVAFGMGRSQKQPAFSGLECRLQVVPRVSEAFELYVYVTDAKGELEVSWSYNTDLFSAETIRVWQRSFERVIEQIIAASPEQSVAALDAVATADQQRLLSLAWGRMIDYSDHLPVHRRIAISAARQPDAVAVLDADGSYTYAQLDARANRIAHFLISKSLKPGSLVGVCLDRSFDLVAVLVGVWRAGLGYVPLDPTYPAQRIEIIVEDSGSTLAITSRALRDRVPSGAQTICLEDAEADLIDRPTIAPNVLTGPEDTAYVIFTSGSTGRPKGVQIPQRAVENFVGAIQHAPGFDESDSLLAITTISFDISVLELFVPLVAGGSVTVATREQAMDPAALQRLLSENGITVMQATPATWQMLFEGGWTGNRQLKVLCGGEAFPKGLAERFLSTCGEVWNVYGPTETTVWSTVAQVTDAEDLAIGRPLDNTSVYVLDERQRLSPPGAHGELWIGGKGVALGYLGRPELTAERFAKSPFDAVDVIYRTGDLARMRVDGELECLGRIDNQVKVRGFRIELGEIEAQLGSHPAVRQCVVVARDDISGERALVAYCVPETGRTITATELQQHLQASLPRYMWPALFETLDELPQTPNGKVDRKRLPAPTVAGTTSQSTDGPRESGVRNDLDLGVLTAWQERLQRSDITIDDDFFALGGDSMAAIRLLADMKKAVGLEIPLAILFEHPTVRGVVDHAGGDSNRAASVVKLNAATGGRPIYCIAGVLLYKPFAECFEDAPVYGVFAPREIASIENLHSDEPIVVPTEQLAETYADALQRHADGKELSLVGVSFGGILALELAQVLERRGILVTSIILLDTVLRGTYQRSLGRGFRDVASLISRDGALSTTKQLSTGAYRKFDRQLSRRRLSGGGEPTSTNIASDAAQAEAFLRMSRGYDPTGKQFAYDVLLVKALRKNLTLGQWLLNDYGFGQIVSGVITLAEIDTEHLGMLRGEAARELHRIVTGYMSRCSKPDSGSRK